MWYPLWRLSVAQESQACAAQRPSLQSAWTELRAFRRGPYTGLSATAAVQVIYPGSRAVQQAAQHHLGATALQAQMLSGAALAPVVAVWKTTVLAATPSARVLRGW